MNLAWKLGRLDCAGRANDPEPNKKAYRFVADYVRSGGFVSRELRALNWNSADMYMTVVPGMPPSYPDLQTIFVMVLGQCDEPPVRDAPFFEIVELPPGSGQWQTEGGYPLTTYTMKVD